MRASTTVDQLGAECPEIDERLIISPTNGIFTPGGDSGRAISAGQAIGTVGDQSVASPFAGQLMGFLALPGERVHRSQALAWLRPPSLRSRISSFVQALERPSMTIAQHLGVLLADASRIGIKAYDGSSAGAPDAATVIDIRSPAGLRSLLLSPSDLGFARAYLAGDLEIEGDLLALLEYRKGMAPLTLDRARVRELIKELRRQPGRLSIHPPTAQIEGQLHRKARDQEAVQHHYDASNSLFQLVLDPSLTYTCAVFEHETDTLEEAQRRKHDLVCRKLGLQPGMRLLDVGCGWGATVLHAAQNYGVRAVGITISEEQYKWATERVAAADLTEKVEIRLQDYRDIADETFDAICSLEMVEHVGDDNLGTFFGILRRCLAPTGRCLIQCGTRPHARETRLTRKSLVDHYVVYKYVFPGAQTFELGAFISQMHASGLEVRHVEGIGEHYARTFRLWLANLEANWEKALAVADATFVKGMRLFMAGAAVNMADGDSTEHQVVAVKAGAG